MANRNKTILVTGGTGLIGKYTLEPLVKAGFRVYVLTSSQTSTITYKPLGVTYITCNLLNATKERLSYIVKSLKPTHLLCMAWCTTGDYLTSTLNELFYNATLSLVKLSVKFGGCKRVILAGTCFEYDFEKVKEYYRISEKDDIAATTPYGYYKIKLSIDVDKFCRDNNIEFAYGRIFYVYGYPSKKFVVTMIKNALANKDISLSGNIKHYDYMYMKDVGRALAMLTSSSVIGFVNICYGWGITLYDLAKCIMTYTNSSSKIVTTDSYIQKYNMIGDNSRLKEEVGFTPAYTFTTGIQEMIEQIKADNV